MILWSMGCGRPNALASPWFLSPAGRPFYLASNVFLISSAPQRPKKIYYRHVFISLLSRTISISNGWRLTGTVVPVDQIGGLRLPPGVSYPVINWGVNTHMFRMFSQTGGIWLNCSIRTPYHTSIRNAFIDVQLQDLVGDLSRMLS